MTSNDDRLRTFRELTPLLRSLAYRMLGSVADSDDIVQEAFVRWEGASAEEIRSPKAYLTTVITRLCIDSRRSARARHEQYVGTWLPEPAHPRRPRRLLTRPRGVRRITLGGVSHAPRVPVTGRAEPSTFCTRPSTSSTREIAPIVGKSEDNFRCRQIARVVPLKLRSALRKPRHFTPSREEPAPSGDGVRRVHRLEPAVSTRLAALFAHDIELWSDGGPSARARASGQHVWQASPSSASVPSFASFRRPLMARPRASSGASQTSAASFRDRRDSLDGRVVSAITFVAEDGLIRSIYIVADPEKLSKISLPS